MTDTTSPIVLALDLADIIIERRNTIPILENVLLTSQGGDLVVEASDLDVELSITVPIPASGDFAASVGLDSVRAAVAYMGDDATLKLVGNKRLFVGDTFELSCLDPSDFPRITPFPDRIAFEVDGDTLLSDLERCAQAMSREETRYYLNGVYFHSSAGESGNVFKLAATDGHRLFAVTRPAPAFSVGDHLSAIVPTKLVKLLIAALRAWPGERVSFRMGENNSFGATRTEIAFGPLFVRAKCIDGQFPDYPRVIPTTEEGAILADAAELARAVSAVAVIHGSGEKTRAAVFTFGGPDEKMISASNPESGSMSLPCPGVREGNPPPRIGLNAYYLETMLASFDGEVRVSFGDAHAPVLFRSTADRALVGVQMPMRV